MIFGNNGQRLFFEQLAKIYTQTPLFIASGLAYLFYYLSMRLYIYAWINNKINI